MKKNTRKRNWILIGAGIAVYLLLLCLLPVAESASDEAVITSVPKAFWYSITTLTTVGYGDMFPVTVPGKAIGVVFQLMSLGVLAALAGLVFSLLRGHLLPRRHLRRNRNRAWFVFAQANLYTENLAAGIRKTHPDSLTVFADDPLSLPEILACRGPEGAVTVFFFGEDFTENERRAMALAASGVRVCCMTEHEPENLPENVIRFDPYESCARQYWKTYPLRRNAERVALIGGGKYASALLEQALLLNVLDENQQIRYELRGSFAEFYRLHPYLDRIIHPNTAEGETDAQSGDRLIFAGVDWNADLPAIADADRIILSFDAESETAEVLTALMRYCPVRGKVFARLSVPFEGAVTFGTAETLFTPEIVLQQELNRLAMQLHAQYLAASSSSVLPKWRGLGVFLRRSNLAAADHLETKVRILTGEETDGQLRPEQCRRAYEVFRSADPEKREKYRRIEHIRWMRFHILNNWQYAPQRDNAKRLHPLLLPFEQLSEEDRAKDDYAWELLRQVQPEEASQ